MQTDEFFTLEDYANSDFSQKLTEKMLDNINNNKGLENIKGHAPENVVLPIFQQDNAPVHQYMLGIDGETAGPFTKDQVMKLYFKGDIDGDILIWRTGYQEWVSLSESLDFAGLL